MGAGGTASTIVIEKPGTYDKQTGSSIEWLTIENWLTVDDLVNNASAKQGNPKERQGKGQTSVSHPAPTSRQHQQVNEDKGDKDTHHKDAGVQ
jgi:hypothetical protein